MTQKIALFGFLSAIFAGCFYAAPIYVKADDTFPKVAVQPAKALEIAEPYLKKHATYHWKPEKPLKTHIVKYRKWYYVMPTNYPAKTIHYYLQPAVRIHVQSGEVSFVEKQK